MIYMIRWLDVIVLYVSYLINLYFYHIIYFVIVVYHIYIYNIVAFLMHFFVSARFEKTAAAVSHSQSTS